jgi:hypothetical protein
MLSMIVGVHGVQEGGAKVVISIRGISLVKNITVQYGTFKYKKASIISTLYNQTLKFHEDTYRCIL